MILDVLDNARNYFALNSGFMKAFEFLARQDIASLSDGRHDVDGDRVYVLKVNGRGRKKENSQLEVHRKYIDIQMVISGIDEMGWRALYSCEHPAGGYDPDKDIQFFKDQPDVWVPVKSGSFALFFPWDAHMPMISGEMIHKAIAKVAVD